MTGWKPSRPILMTVDPIGGVWNYALDLCRELGHCEIALASMGKPLTKGQRAQVEELAHVELFESDFKLEWMDDPWRDIAAAGDWLGNLVETIRPCLVHLNQFAHGALAWNMPCLVVGHSCVYSWFQAVKGRPPEDDWREYKSMVSRGLRGANRVTAPSRWMLSSLVKAYGEFAAAEPIYNGRSAGDFVPIMKEDFILTAGRLWDEAKNIAVLDAIAARQSWPIYAAGENTGPNGAQIPLEHLRLLGRLDAATLAQWMGRAQIFILPARYEPFGLSVLEAALAGCALVLGDIPSLREIWHDAALFVGPDNAEEIAAAVAALIADAHWRNRLAHRARNRALAFTPLRMAQAYMALYREMLSLPRSRAGARAESFSQIDTRYWP
jgi:glycogen synthase